MDRTKFIHVLLVALLCHGQLAANTHIIDHFDDHVSDASGSEVASHCQHLSDDKPGSAPHSHPIDCLAHNHAHVHADDHHSAGTEAEANCAIYHAVLSLNGVFYAVHTDPPVFSQHSQDQPTSSHAVAHARTDNSRIRAPPAFS